MASNVRAEFLQQIDDYGETPMFVIEKNDTFKLGKDSTPSKCPITTRRYTSIFKVSLKPYFILKLFYGNLSRKRKLKIILICQAKLLGTLIPPFVFSKVLIRHSVKH